MRLKSSSGGVFSLLARAVLEQGGVVFGAGYAKPLLDSEITNAQTSNLEVRHSFIESLQDLDNFRRSKYVESPIGDCFIKAKEFLRVGRLVLFSGVQCQIHGLNAFLRKKYPNLLTIEVICNSVPSPKIWRIYKESMLDGEDSQLLDFNFRGKDYGWERGIFAAKTKTIPHTLSPYYTGFLGHTTTRPSCENCFSKDMRSGADITLGDFWGVRNFHPDFVDDKGISCVIFNNANAHKWLDSITSFAKVEKSSIYAVLSGNRALVQSGFVNKKRKKILTEIINLYEQKCKEFGADSPQSLARQKAARKAVNLLHELTKTPFLTRLVRFVKRCIKKVILLLLPRKAKDFLKPRIKKLRQRIAR
ncbi:Coenzyme F420 hydrogenase/dehydrogenase, beta subunit C-terminal domain [Helicobacter himalayensis]|uniref:Coenzyme F420 hydrogenase/dehydrogenase, beta subunit C-terminal domain n=1 Tax=Helicobacter himalayensis TaxID=1591088 RepID=UPI003D6ECF61